ncbi:AAA family ATPase [Streptomyces sp. NPDC002078]
MSGIILFGRDEELPTVDELVDGLPERGSALLIRGATGIGKSCLLDHATTRARNSGFTVLRASGVQAETHLPFAGLHQLTHTMTDRVSRLPPTQADALLGAFGMAEPSPGASVPQFFMIALATLSLLGDAAAEAPVLLVVDDAQWLDTPTLDVLGFIARRLGVEPLGLLLAHREGRTASLGAPDLRELHLKPLEPTAADALLDARNPGLDPGVRRRVVEMSAGNPLALIELPVTLGADAVPSESVALPALPLTAKLERAFASRLADLPSGTRHALLVTAAADDGALTEVLAAASMLTGTEMSAHSLEPAIAAGLVCADEFRIGFTHPLVRSAVLGAATLADRLAAHGALADVFHAQPDRQAWHRAAAIGRPDEAVARQLDQVALRARRRGAAAVAMTALERATTLSEVPSGRVARLLGAAEPGLELGRTDRVSSLLQQAEQLELGVLERARLLLLREGLEVDVATSTPRLHLLISTAERACEAGDPELALRLLRMAARRCWWSDPGRKLRERVVAAAERLPGSPSRPSVWSHGANGRARNSARQARAASVKAVPTGNCSHLRSCRSPSSQRKASPTRR